MKKLGIIGGTSWASTALYYEQINKGIARRLGGLHSAVLSIGVSFESNAQVAAVFAEKVLTGKAKVSELKVGIVSPPDIAVNMQKARQIGLAIPFSWFESASYVYDYEGRPVRTSSRLMAGDS